MTRPATTGDTGHRRRAGDAPRVIGELLDSSTVQAIAEDAWTALVGEDEVLLPVPGELPEDALSGWVDVVGPWSGRVVLTTGRATAADLTSALLGDAAPDRLDDEDVADALGELANVVGGNVKATLPGPSALGLPVVGRAPAAGDAADLCRVELQWRGQALAISVQGGAAPGDAVRGSAPARPAIPIHRPTPLPLPQNGADQ